MTWRLVPIASLSAALLAASPAGAQSRHGGRGSSHHGYSGTRPAGPAVNPVSINPSRGGGCPPYGNIYPVFFGGWGYPVLVGYPTPLVIPPGAESFYAPMMPSATGPILPLVMDAPQAPALAPVSRPAPRPIRRDANKAREFTTLGDRLFRAGNLARAVDRYEQAVRAEPESATPRARLAQVAVVRGKYREAAEKLREAQTADPGWLATAGDVQSLYPEPADFARHVAKLEAHLQTHPEDRDGWLVLGALWYLSGRTAKAADVFLRLSDRREDPTLRAFLAASKAE